MLLLNAKGNVHTVEIMAIESFVAEYPSVAIVAIAVLFGAVGKLITQPYVHLTTAINALTQTVKEGQEEVKAYREKDQTQVGLILDRLQKQETLCVTVRSFCPHANRRVGDTSIHPTECQPN